MPTPDSSNTPDSPKPPQSPNNRVTRRYVNDQDYTRDARNMAVAGWRVRDLTRESGGVIVATFEFEAPASTPTPAPTPKPNPASAPSSAPSAAPTAASASTRPTRQGNASGSASIAPSFQSAASAMPPLSSASMSSAEALEPEPMTLTRPVVEGAQLFPGGAKLLLAFWTVYLLNGWLLFLGIAVRPAYAMTFWTVALIALFAECVGLLVWDGRNIVTLFGALDWRSMPWWERVAGGAVCLLAFPTFYLWLATVRHFRAVGKTHRGYVRQLGHNLRMSSGLARVGLVAATLALVIVFCSSGTMVMALAPALPQSAAAQRTQVNRPLTTSGAPVKVAPTQTQALAPSTLPTATATTAPTATAAPTATTTAVPPTPTPKPRPTATPRPPAPTATPKPTGVNGNPWGYNFSCCTYIYSPPSNFCDYFDCIPSFWTSTNGYVEECQDGTYSHSGGRSGSCSYHGGNLRALLQP